MKQRKSFLLLTIIMMDLLTGMEFDLFVPSFPELQDQFKISSFWVEALLSVNFIGFCLSLFIVGRLGDQYGRKPIILSGLALFILGTLLCLFSSLYPVLLIGRFLQGLGVAAPAILSFLIVTDLYPLKEQQFLLAMLNGVMNAAAGLAPVLGSYITLYFNWEGNFVALLFLGVMALVMTLIFIPHDVKRKKDRQVLTSSSYVRLLRHKELRLLILTFITLFVPYWVFVGVSPLLYREGLSVSLSHFGFYQGSLALVFALGCFLYGMMLRKTEENKMQALSMILILLSSLCLIWLSIINTKSPLLITAAMLLFVAGQIVPTTLLYPYMLTLVPEAKGRVTALIQAGRLLLASFGLQLAGFFYNNSFMSIGFILSSFMLLSLLMFRLSTRKRLVEG